MAAEYQSHYTTATYTQTGSITIDNPATVDAGDILLYFIQQQPAATQGTISSDNALTELENVVGAAFEGSIALYSLEADGTEDGGSEDFSSTDTSTVMDGICVRITGADVVSDSSSVLNGSNTTMDVPTVTAASADSLLVSIAGGGSEGSEWTPTQPTGMTLGDTAFQAWAASTALAYETVASGATGAQQWAVPSAFGTWGVNVVLTEAATGVTGTGALASADSTVSGTGTASSEVTGSGALAADDSAVVGMGEREIVDVGSETDLETADSTASGAGEVGKTGTGAVVNDVSVVSGVGEREVTATGTPASAASTTTGSGTVSGSAPDVTGIGVLAASASTVAGTGLVNTEQTGTGVLAAEDATVQGAGNAYDPNVTSQGRGRMGLNQMSMGL